MKRPFWKARERKTEAFFTSYLEALDSTKSDGYQSDNLVDAVVQKNIIYRDNLKFSRAIDIHSLRLMVGLGAINKWREELSVLDFGGGGGTQFFAARTVRGAEQSIKWGVVETNKMVESANKSLSGNGLSFFNNIEEARDELGKIDLVFASGSLQYTPDPLAALEKLIALKADHLYVTRTPFKDQNVTLFAVQQSRLSDNGPGPLPAGFDDGIIRYPVTFAPKREVEELIKDTYAIRFSIQEDRNAYSVQSRKFDMCGYFCDLKN